MNITRCENGHFYDHDKYPKCPFCVEETDDSTTFDDAPTGMVENDDNGLGSVKVVEEPKNVEPVTGWLVAIAGPHFGEDFKIVAGRNRIGRSDEMDIVIRNDITVAREKHAVVIYDPKSNAFMLQSGYAKSLCYLNGKVVVEAEPLKPNDVLSIGKTDLLFIPCCSKKFNWTMVEKDK